MLALLVSALLLLGMAGLTAVAVDRHFEVLDRDTLHDKIELIQDSVARSDSASDLSRRLDDALQNHPGLFVRVDDAAAAAPPLGDTLEEGQIMVSKDVYVVYLIAAK